MATAPISTIIIGVIIFTLFIFGGVAMISEMGTVDSSFIDSTKFIQFNNTFNKYTTLQSSVSGMQSSVTSAETDFGLFGVLNGLIQVAWNTILTIFTSFSFINDIFAGLYTMMGIPAWISNLIISIITITFVFGIFALIFQRDA